MSSTMTKTHGELMALIRDEVGRMIQEKGAEIPAWDAETEFLSGALPFDSLDLATLIVRLEELTGKDPFRNGFVEFRKMRELAALYVD